MSTPTIGYAVLPIIPSLRGMDAEIRKQLSSASTAAGQVGAQAGAAWNDSFVEASGLDAAGQRAAGMFAGGMSRGLSQSGMSESVSKAMAAPDVSDAGTKAGQEFSAAVQSQLLSLPVSQRARMEEMLRQSASASHEASQKAAKDAAGATAEAERAGRLWGRKFVDGVNDGVDNLSGLKIDDRALTMFGVKALAVGGIAAVGLGKAASAADELGAALSANEQVFGAASASIDKWSENSADAFGLSKRAATEAATAFGAFGKQAGLQGEDLSDFATGLAELASDLAAFDNSTVVEALEALQSGLTGQVMPLRRYQILLSESAVQQKAYAMGIAESGSQLTEQQKVLARHALIFDQATDKIGQFQREIGELNTQQQIMAANWEDAQAALGEALLPVLTSAAQSVNTLLQSFRDLDPGTQAFIAQLAGIAAVGTVAVGGLSLAAGAGLRLADAYGRMRTAALAGNTALARTGRVAVGASKALGAAGLAFAAWQAADAINDATRNSVALETAILDLSSATSKVDIGRSLYEGAAASEGALDEVLDFFVRVGQLGRETPSVTFGEFTVEIDNLSRYLEHLHNTDPEGLAKAIGYLRAEMSQSEGGWGFEPWDSDSAQAFQELQGELDEYERNLDSAGRAQAAYTEEQQATEIATNELTDAKDKLNTALGFLAQRQALLTLEFDAGRAAADAFGAALERATPADNLLKAGLGVSSAMRELRDGIIGQGDSAKEAAQSTDSLAEALDRVNRELEWSDPAMTAAAIGYQRLAASAQAFRDSMSRNVIAGQVASALALGEVFRDFSKTMRRLPPEIDMVAASTGRYRPRQVEAIRTMLELGDATTEYLAAMLEAGKSQDAVRAEANRLRDAYIEQFRAAGMTEAQIKTYIDTLGLTPEAVETAIRLSGVEAARFEIQTYLQLLEGRIPESVAASVSAKIAAGDLESAAQELATLAASNPVVIPVDVDTGKIDEAKREIGMEIPRTFDFAKAAMGGYTAEQERGLEAVLALGDATKNYLSELVASGKGDQAISEAERLREEYRKQFEQFGITGAAFDEYADKLLGLNIEDIKVGIDVASFAADVFKVETLLSLLEEDLTIDEKLEIAAALLHDDFDAALGVLEGRLHNWESERGKLQIQAQIDEGFMGMRGMPTIQVGLDTTLADDEANKLGVRLGRAIATVPVTADTKDATDKVDGFKWAAGQDPAVIPIDGDPSKLKQRLEDLFPKGSIGQRMWGWDWGRAATGGLITGPGGPTSDSIPMLLSNGEYVISAKAVRNVGVDLLDAINTGNLATVDPRTGTTVAVDYSVVEAKTHPTAADVAREVALAARMAGL